MKKTIQTLLIIGLIAVPAIALAQGVAQVNQGLTTFSGIITTFTQTIVRSLATLFPTAAMVAFFYGIVKYIWGVREGKEEQIRTGNQFMLWGLIALFVMFSVWGIVNLAQRIFGIQGQNTINIPEIKLQTGSSPSATPTDTALPTGVPPSAGNQELNRANTSCVGKPDGTACTISGRAGTCGITDDGSTRGCFANSGSSSVTPQTQTQTQGNTSACASIANPVLQQDCYNNNNNCPAGQAMTAQGCQRVQ